ncbi:MAG: bacteriohemerythrin [Myxococcota bacterium]
MFVDWQPRFSVGVPNMDAAHKKLMGLMNQLHEQRAAGEGKAALRSTLKALADYTAVHFREEEAFMQAIGFPGIDSHKRIHAQLLGQLSGHFDAFEASEDGLPDQFFTFLKVWLTAHIMGIDGKYGEHARTHR